MRGPPGCGVFGMWQPMHPVFATVHGFTSRMPLRFDFVSSDFVRA